MNDLPIELIDHILQYLDIKNLIKLRLISKKFNSILKCFKLKELILNDDSNDNWFMINEKINEQYLINYEFKFLKSNLFNFNYLKKLKISNNNQLNLSVINENCSNLEYLQIWFDFFDDQYDYRLILNKLKILFIEFDIQYGSAIVELHTPLLSSIFVDDLNWIKFMNPLSIKDLYCLEFDSKILQFKNLEFISIHSTSTIIDNILSYFSNLKVLNFELKSSNQNLMVNRIFRKKSKKQNLFYSNILIVDQKFLEQFNFEDTFSMHIKYYYLLIDNLYMYQSIDYIKLMNLFNHKLPDDFHKKFNNLQIVRVIGDQLNKVNNSDHLCEFIKNVQNLTGLQFSDTGLSQSFFDKLPYLALNLWWLEIDEIIDFSFKSKFRHLTRFSTDLHNYNN